jgi:hypothetical protein
MVFATVDNAKIDQIALFSSKDDSEKLLLEDDGKGHCKIRDPNVKQVFFLPRGDKWSIVGSGNLFLASSDKRELQSTSIGVDKRAAIANAEREAQQLNEELKRCKAEDGKYEAEHTQRQKDWNLAKRAMQKNDDKINDLATQIFNLNSEIQASVSIRFDPSEYEEDVRQADLKLEKLNESRERLETELENRKPEINDLEGQIAEVDARNKKVLADIDAVQVRIDPVLGCFRKRSCMATHSHLLCRKSNRRYSTPRLRRLPSTRSERVSSRSFARRPNPSRLTCRRSLLSPRSDFVMLAWLPS